MSEIGGPLFSSPLCPGLGGSQIHDAGPESRDSALTGERFRGLELKQSVSGWEAEELPINVHDKNNLLDWVPGEVGRGGLVGKRRERYFLCGWICVCVCVIQSKKMPESDYPNLTV